MKLLIVTQAVDMNDPVLGFFHRWIEEFAKQVEQIQVVALKVGKFNFPKNVRVYSLGKEHGAASRAVYSIRFLRLAWRLRHNYETVFVHMNQEYVLIAGWLWKLLGKRVYMWRNHYAGSWLTDVAALFCTNVFCTSKHSYTATYKKTILMPVGVDTDRFKPDSRVRRIPHSILSFGRIAPSKRIDLLIDALAQLKRDGVNFTADIVGSPLPRDEAYYEHLKEKVRLLSLADRVIFRPGIPNSQAPDLYREHTVFVNMTASGSFDKMLFEAAACGCQVLASSDDWRALAGEDAHFDSSKSLAARLKDTLETKTIRQNPAFVQGNSLEVLGRVLQKAMYTV